MSLGSEDARNAWLLGTKLVAERERHVYFVLVIRPMHWFWLILRLLWDWKLVPWLVRNLRLDLQPRPSSPTWPMRFVWCAEPLSRTVGAGGRFAVREEWLTGSLWAPGSRPSYTWVERPGHWSLSSWLTRKRLHSSKPEVCFGWGAPGYRVIGTVSDGDRLLFAPIRGS